MFDSFRSLLWSASVGSARVGSTKTGPCRSAWSLDRNWDRTEGERLLKSRNYAAAEKFLARAATDAEIQGYSTTKRIQVRLLLAEAQRKQFEANQLNPDHGKLDAAEQTVRSAIELAADSSDGPAYLQCLDALADIFSGQGNFAAVEKVTQDAIQMEANQPHPDPLSMARRVHRLGIARHQQGRSDDAIPTLEKAVALHEASYGPEHRETGDQLTALGAVHRAQGNHKEAQQYLRRALKIHEKTCGIQSPEAIQDLHHLAGSLEESGDLEAAAAQYERALSFKNRIIGGDLNELAQMQFGMAGLHIKWQNYSRARELLMEAVGGFKRKGGVPLAVGYETLAFVEEYSGRYTDAVKELERASLVWDTLKPERLPELIRNLEHRAELLEMLRKKGEASWLREKVARLTAPVDAGEPVTAA
jgi:tetratricopeptide (TPR) repeat protein